MSERSDNILLENLTSTFLIVQEKSSDPNSVSQGVREPLNEIYSTSKKGRLIRRNKDFVLGTAQAFLGGLFEAHRESLRAWSIWKWFCFKIT